MLGKNIFKIGDQVLYRVWGSFKHLPCTITGIGVKHGETVYDNSLGHWGYINQYSPNNVIIC